LALETGYGKSIIAGTNNLGNIKDFSGKGVKAYDKAEGSHDAYKVYASLDDFFVSYIDLIKRKYPGAMGAKTAEAFAGALKAGGYATDPNYVKSVAATAANFGGAGSTNDKDALESQSRRNELLMKQVELQGTISALTLKEQEALSSNNEKLLDIGRAYELAA
jgi:flagellum-specific peptidoglycan hydrolase FlgJ